VADRFLLSIALTAAPQFDALLSEVASGVLQQTGYAPAEAEEILHVLRASLAQHTTEGCRECSAAFRLEGGRLVIDVIYAGGREWRLTRPLPSPG
jgi:hypothetical protein